MSDGVILSDGATEKSTAATAASKFSIDLYSVLIDQLTKYNTIIWQFPAVLFAANTVALDKAGGEPKALLLLALVNIPFAYAFQRLVRAQNKLISAVQKAEAALKVTQPDFIPDFGNSYPALRATTPMLIIIWFYSLLIAMYSCFMMGSRFRCFF